MSEMRSVPRRALQSDGETCEKAVAIQGSRSLSSESLSPLGTRWERATVREDLPRWLK